MTHDPPSPRSQFRRALETIVFWLGRPSLVVLVLLITLFIILLGATALWITEQSLGGEPEFHNWGSAFWYMLQSVAGISVGAKVPLTEAGRVLAIIAGVLGTAVKGVFTAAVASAFVNRLIVEGRGLGDVNFSNHIVICGWNNHAREMVNVLGDQAFGRGVPVVLLAELNENPLPRSRIRFLHGDPTLDSDLNRACVTQARSVIILADDSHGPKDDSTVDARTVLTALAIETLNSHVYTIAEVRDPANRRHFARTRTDELVASSEIAGGLLGRTALTPGIGHVFTTLMRLDQTAEVLVTPAPKQMWGKSFDDVLKLLRREHRAILIGLSRKGDVVLSPTGEQKLEEGDGLVVISNSPLNL
jgi:voltage-gated potassium channel